MSDKTINPSTPADDDGERNGDREQEQTSPSAVGRDDGPGQKQSPDVGHGAEKRRRLPPDVGGENPSDASEPDAAGPASGSGVTSVFDPAYLGLSQDFAAESSIGKLWDIIKVEKPSKSRVFRVHPGLAFRLKTLLLTLKEDNETYLIHPTMRAALANESLVGVYTIFACVSKQGTPALWPIRMQDGDGKWNIWHQSAFAIAEKAMVRWARMQANRDAGYYVAEYDMRPLDQQLEPAWPNIPFSRWLELAFKGYIIDSPDHPILRRLRMED